MAEDQNKLVGILHLEQGQLGKDVEEANKLQKSIGVGVDMDVSKLIDKGIKDNLQKIVNDIKKAVTDAGGEISKIGTGVTDVTSKITTLGKETIKWGKDTQVTVKGYDELGRTMTEVYKNGQKISATVVKDNHIQEANRAWKQLIESQRNYNTALLKGNNEGAAYWQKSIDGANATIDRLGEIGKIVGEETGARQKVETLIQKGREAQDAQTASAKKYSDVTDKIASKLLSMVGTLVIMRGLSNLWREATSYAQTYYDKMNEIRIVTGKSEKEAAKLGDSYRKLAKDMKVSSTEIATAAVEFWRQGQGENEVNARLVSTIQYAKISGLEFKEAAELVTAATNTMEVSAKRVADVWSFLGDESASG